MAWYHDHLNAYHSKITLPNYIEENLPRDNIIRIIDSTPLDKIVYMVAPFGYGKTQAVLQWLEKNDLRCAFCCLDNSDNRADSLLGTLTAAILSALDLDNLKPDLLDYQNYFENPRSFLHNAALSVRDTKGG